MKRLLLPLLIATTAATARAGEYFDAPSDWESLGITNPAPQEVTAFEAYASPGDEIRAVVSFIEKSAVESQGGADAMMRGQRKSIEKGGSKYVFTKRTNIRGYDARHQRFDFGEIAGRPQLMDSYAFFMEKSVVSISFVFDADTHTSEEMFKLLDRINLPEEPFSLPQSSDKKKNLREDTFAYKTGQIFGKILVYVLIGGLAFFGIRAVARSTKKDRAYHRGIQEQEKAQQIESEIMGGDDDPSAPKQE